MNMVRIATYVREFVIDMNINIQDTISAIKFIKYQRIFFEIRNIFGFPGNEKNLKKIIKFFGTKHAKITKGA